jgi:hypothetical protein
VIDFEDEVPPPDVTDIRLWRDTQPVLRRHSQDVFPHEKRCSFCHRPWPCQPRLWADQADRLSRNQDASWHRDEFRR